MRTEHQQRVYHFMVKAGQETPDTPCIPDEKTRLLRAKLIFEEAMETIQALGVIIRPKGDPDPVWEYPVFETDYKGERLQPNLIEIADGCADLSVVAMGTLIACGIQDKELLEEVDRSNLDKFRGDAHRAEDGKWVKPSDWKAPDIKGVLNRQEQRLARAQDDGPDYEHDSENFALSEIMTPVDKDKPERETAPSLNTRQEYKPAECRACRTPLSQGMVRRIGGTEGIRCPNCLIVLLSKDDVIIYA